MRIEIDARHRALLSAATSLFADRDVPAWATGGFLRDSILARHPRDIDLTIAGDPLALAPALAETIDAHVVTLDARRGHVRLIQRSGDGYIDMTPLRSPTIEDDLRLRDYTVNALAKALRDLLDSDIGPIDPTGGLADLESRIIRVISEQALVDDPVRLLRGVRIATQLSFEIEPETAALLSRHAARVAEAAPERQREELIRIFACVESAPGVRLMEQFAIFPRVLPEMDVTREVEQPKEHAFDVLGHSFAAVECLDWLLSETPPTDAAHRQMWDVLWGELAWCPGVRDHLREEIVLGTPRHALLKFCGLLHDIGKPETKSFQDDGRMRFFGHHEVGAELAVRLMRRLRFSSREIKIVRAMIRAHLRPIQLGEQGAPSKRAVLKFFRDTGEAAIDTLLLSIADHLATVGHRVSAEGFARHVALTSYILHLRYDESGGLIAPVRLLSGDDILANLGLEPGPVVGELLAAIREGQELGEISTREEALALAKRTLAEARTSSAEG